MKNAYLLIAFLILSGQMLYAQCNPDPDPMSGIDCNQAELLCCGEFTGISGTLPVGPAPFGPTPLCPGASTVPNNTAWYSFVAGSTNMVFDVNITNCTPTQQGVGGMQVGIYEGCDFAFSVYCNGGENVGLLSVPLFNLIIGEAYFFFLDGFAGSVCDYEINLVQGSNFSVDPGPVTDILGPQEVCPGQSNDVFTAQLSFGATDAIWTLEPGITANMFGTTLVVSDWGNNVGNSVTICAEGINPCNPDPTGTNQFCRTVDVTTQDSISISGSYCSSDVGYLFTENGLLYAAGVHEVFIDAPGECPTRYELTIDVLPSENINEEFFLDFGETYTTGGTTFIAPFFGQFDNGQIGTNG